MKIPAINLNLVNFKGSTPNTQVQYGVGQRGNLAPLASDTVNFTGKVPDGSKAAKKAAKVVEECISGLPAGKVLNQKAYPDFNYSIAMELKRESEFPMSHVRLCYDKYLDKYVADSNNKDRIIHDLKYRVKEADSIEEKLISEADNNKKKAKAKGELPYLQRVAEARELLSDIIGNRVVMRDASKKAVGTVLHNIAKLVRGEDLMITSIEVYRPVISGIPENILKKYQKELGIKLTDKELKAMKRTDYFSYAWESDIKKLAEACREKNPDLVVEYGKDRPNGYQAIHLNYTLADDKKSKGECQIMGVDIEELKDAVEDAIYKAKCGKKVVPPRVIDFLEKSDDPKAKLLLEKVTDLLNRLKPLSEKEKEAALIAMMTDYTRWAYIGQRLKAILPYNRKVSESFLVAPQEILDRGLGFNQLKPLVKAASDAKKMYKKAMEAKSKN